MFRQRRRFLAALLLSPWGLTTNTATTSRISLPNELILLIASYLGYTDLKHLILTNRHLAWLLTDCLYDRVCASTLLAEQKLAATALCTASNMGYETVVRHLLRRGTSLRITSAATGSDPPLHLAVRAGHVGIVGIMLEQEAAEEALRMTDTLGMAPLHVAAQLGHVGILKAILEKKIDPNLPGESSKHDMQRPAATALHYAAAWGREEAIAVLLENGAMVNSRTQDGYQSTPLHWAAENCCYQIKYEDRDPEPVIKKLLENGADAKLGDHYGRTALHIASIHGEYMTQAWISAREEGKFGRSERKKHSVLWRKRHKVIASHKAITALLLLYGADINARTKEGSTPLHSAAPYQELYIIRNLLDLGADINALTKWKQTPLIQVVGSYIRGEKQRNTIKVLVESGADLDIRDEKERSALDIAEGRYRYCPEDKELVQLLRRLKALQSPHSYCT